MVERRSPKPNVVGSSPSGRVLEHFEKEYSVDKEKANTISFKDSIIQYFKGVRLEWGKITWPEKQQIVSQTIAVVVIVTIFTLYTYGLDKLFLWIIKVLKIQS